MGSEMCIRDRWNRTHHGASGLTRAARESTLTNEVAEEQLVRFLGQHCEEGTGILAGSSIHNDRAFIRARMPRLHLFLHYRHVDVSAIRTLLKAWYPDHPKVGFKKVRHHRAADDIRETIAELRHYRQFFFLQEIPDLLDLPISEPSAPPDSVDQGGG